eukprot:scaffold127403_cov54-Attheya_sp.AAC.6
MADARTFHMMPHSAWMGPLRAGIFVIGLSDLGPKKKYPPYRLRASGMFPQFVEVGFVGVGLGAGTSGEWAFLVNFLRIGVRPKDMVNLGGGMGRHVGICGARPRHILACQI